MTHHSKRKHVFRWLVGNLYRGLLRKLAETFGRFSVVLKRSDLIYGINQMQQIQLMLTYKTLLSNRDPLPALHDVEFRSYSQNGEDGILLFIFSLIGSTNRVCIEIGAGDGIECNCANLIINHGWKGLLFDGNRSNVKRGIKFYQTVKGTHSVTPVLVHTWIKRSNINELIKQNGLEGPIDLLSIDLDGVDWHIWDAIEVVTPRVIVVEFNAGWGANEAVTVPYQDDFEMEFAADGMTDAGMTYYGGASLAAFAVLGHRKGYRLVGVQRRGFNAFFVKNGIADDILPEVRTEDCVIAQENPRFAQFRKMPWVQIKE